jgi:hypothetical protein
MSSIRERPCIEVRKTGGRECPWEVFWFPAEGSDRIIATVGVQERAVAFAEQQSRDWGMGPVEVFGDEPITGKEPGK